MEFIFYLHILFFRFEKYLDDLLEELQLIMEKHTSEKVKIFFVVYFRGVFTLFKCLRCFYKFPEL